MSIENLLWKIEWPDHFKGFKFEMGEHFEKGFKGEKEGTFDYPKPCIGAQSAVKVMTALGMYENILDIPNTNEQTSYSVEEIKEVYRGWAENAGVGMAIRCGKCIYGNTNEHGKFIRPKTCAQDEYIEEALNAQ